MELLHLNRPEGQRRALFWTASERGPAPLVLFLHGTGSTAEWAADETHWPTFARDHGFHLLVPEALPLDPDRPMRFLSNPNRWNDNATFAYGSPPDDVGFLLTLLRDLVHRAPVDPRRIYVTGFSNGAGMTFRLAAEAPETIAAIAPVAGYCWVTPTRLTRPVPIHYLLGEVDPLIPVAGGQVRVPWSNQLVTRPPILSMLGRWAEANGCATTPVRLESNGYRLDRFPSPQGHEFLLVRIPEHGHHWPGGKGQLNPRIGGIASNRFNANTWIWEFFRRHQKE